MFTEIISAGIYNSDIAIKNKAITESKNRAVSVFEIEIPIEDGGISYIDSECFKITPDIIICAKPGQVRHTRFPFKCFYIHMIPKDEKLYKTLSSIPHFIRTDNRDEYLKIFRGISKYYDSKLEDDELILQSLILKLIYILTKESTKAAKSIGTKSVNYLLIDEVIKYIKENLAENLSLEKVSEYAGFSHIHFHNCFKKATGLTLHDYVEEQRIKKAINMLITTNANLTEISHECGFSSQSYFSYVFKKRMGHTPREYAEKIIVNYKI